MYNENALHTWPKGLLAEAYNPTVCHARAVQILNDWIAHHPTLLSSLQALGYKKTQKLFTPAQVALVFDALGEP